MGSDLPRGLTGRTVRSIARSRLPALVAFIGLCQLAGVLARVVAADGLRHWYPVLAKPAFTPPDVVFDVVSTALYALVGIAAWRVWERRHAPEARGALWLLVFQLGLGVIWSGIFFGLRNPAGAAFEILALWLATLATAVAFAHVDRRAAWLLVPYLAWVAFSGVLTFSIWSLNS